MSVYYRLEVAFPLNPKTMKEDTEKVENIVGRPCSDAGAGFGARDVGWVFQLYVPTKVCADKLRAAGYTDVSITKYDDKK
jgi:hypothetical protein